MERKHIYSVSFGKDSVAMLLLGIDKGLPIDEVVFFNTGVEFDAIYMVRDMILPILAERGIKYTELETDKPFYWYMFEKPVYKKGTKIVHKYGCSWYGGNCRWGTTLKLRALKNYIGDNWGFPVADCYERDVTVVEMVDVIRAIGIYPVRSVHLDALLECVLIGDDDCPECGGEMEVTDGEYRRTGGDGYLTPPEYSPIWEEKTCRNCGYKESNEPSY